MFSECDKISYIDLSNFNCENVTNMNNMFSFCTSLERINLTNLNTSNVINMAAIFNECYFNGIRFV